MIGLPSTRKHSVKILWVAVLEVAVLEVLHSQQVLSQGSIEGCDCDVLD